MADTILGPKVEEVKRNRVLMQGNLNGRGKGKNAVRLHQWSVHTELLFFITCLA